MPVLWAGLTVVMATPAAAAEAGDSEFAFNLFSDLAPAKVERVVYKDLLFIEDMVVAVPQESKNVLSSVRYSAETAWDGKCTASTTSKEGLEIAPATRTPAEVFDTMLVH
ncbi:hypothetical protein B0T14DRAFT_563859 [Immersiella caudata]|uniref:Uncharacterized protein n=1 Tax=Immersiella caudata TaxID=314043 RepID=A0AA39WVP4_9PEZI|nr:hypothetical protein B0T14DRAFT_563859 [Immersiella caudata]